MVKLRQFRLLERMRDSPVLSRCLDPNTCSSILRAISVAQSGSGAHKREVPSRLCATATRALEVYPSKLSASRQDRKPPGCELLPESGGACVWVSGGHLYSGGSDRDQQLIPDRYKFLIDRLLHNKLDSGNIIVEAILNFGVLKMT